MRIIHQIALTYLDAVGDVHAKSLLDYFGSAEAVFSAGPEALMMVPGIGPLIAGQILKSRSRALFLAEQQLRFVEKYGVQVLFYTDERYPYRLRNCHDAPVVLYYKGTADLNHPRIVSIVGTRKATAYGRQLCKQLCEVLSGYNVLVISGLAYGIDVSAHKESLQYHIPTVGVLAHGLDRIYPAQHRPVAEKMLLNGGLLTEFPSGTAPEKTNFPQRNRIIAGIADATIVVEAAARGGALITAELANSYSRDVYAFPGRTSDLCSQGCNFLIRTNRAGLISNAVDFVEFMGWEQFSDDRHASQLQMPLELDPELTRLLEALGHSEMHVDELARVSHLSQGQLAMSLLDLEMLGLLAVLPGKIYRRA